jgi:hypothetical protein
MSMLHPLEEWRLRNGMSVPEIAAQLQINRKSWYALIKGTLPRAALQGRITALTYVTQPTLSMWRQQNCQPATASARPVLEAAQ